MKLDRNLPDNYGCGKYALLLLRRLNDFRSGTFGKLPNDIDAAIKLLGDRGIIDFGITGTDTEFFVMRLKDKYAGDGLASYGLAAQLDDPEYAAEIFEMAGRAGMNSPWCKLPD